MPKLRPWQKLYSSDDYSVSISQHELNGEIQVSVLNGGRAIVVAHIRDATGAMLPTAVVEEVLDVSSLY
jgi:hypothetical protein